MTTRALFSRAFETTTTTASRTKNKEDHQKHHHRLRDAIEMFEEVSRRCHLAGCFDGAKGRDDEGEDDDDDDDVSTNDLKYVLCSYFCGKCWQLMPMEFVEEEKRSDANATMRMMNRKLRVEHVLRSKECLEHFLRFVARRSRQTRRPRGADNDADNTTTTTTTTSDTNNCGRFVPRGFEKETRAAAGLMEEEEEEEETTLTPDAKRRMKVKRFKKQSELRRKLEEMEKSGIVGGNVGVKTTTSKATAEEEEKEEEEEADEERIREYWFAMIENAVLDSIEMIEANKEEVALLTGVSEEEVKRIVEERKNVHAEEEGEDNGSSSSRIPEELLKAIASLESNGATSGRTGMMNRSAPPAGTSTPTSLPSSLFANRKESVVRDARSALFRPSHILPTMTIEQAGEIELRELMERTALSTKREKRRSVLESAKTEDELSDEKLYEKRRWDDWKDDNPFGAGNSRRTPTGNNKR